jgi:dTDP-4-amino-4,6-dideoxygalactose transaminase
MAHLAPAGTPVSLLDIASGLAAAPLRAQQRLCAAMREVSGLAHAWPVSSGRAAMVLILRAMRSAARDPRRDEVIVPAYTCYSVPAAIELAGLKPRLCDIDARTLGMDPELLERQDFSRTLAVISANLYGMPNELAALEHVCRQRGVYLLDDSAQALGASLDGRAAGSFGDAGLYSFDKGKIISTIQGGAIVCRGGELAAAIDAQVAKLPASAALETCGNLAKLVVYSVGLRPGFYGLVRRLAGGSLGRTPYETRYPIARLSAVQTAIAARLSGRIEALNEGRRAQAASLEAALHDIPGISLVQPVIGARGAYARYPVMVREASRRATAIAMLDAAGIGATASYPEALCDVPEVRAKLPAGDAECAVARKVARTIMTLPTHAYCPPDLGARAREALLPWSQ